MVKSKQEHFFIYFEKISKASMVFTRQDMDGRNYKYDKLQ